MRPLDKAIELFCRDMNVKHACLFKAWARIHLDWWDRIFYDTDPYEIIERLLFSVYPGFELLIDKFILKWVSENELGEGDLDLLEITKDYLQSLETIQCLLEWEN